MALITCSARIMVFPSTPDFQSLGRRHPLATFWAILQLRNVQNFGTQKQDHNFGMASPSTVTTIYTYSLTMISPLRFLGPRSIDLVSVTAPFLNKE